MYEEVYGLFDNEDTAGLLKLLQDARGTSLHDVYLCLFRPPTSRNIFHLAASSEDPELLRYLIPFMTQPEVIQKNHRNRNCLTHACCLSTSTNLYLLFGVPGIRPHDLLPDRNTNYLLRACSSGQIEPVRFILEKASEDKSTDKRGRTLLHELLGGRGDKSLIPLHGAIIGGSIDIIKLILDTMNQMETPNISPKDHFLLQRYDTETPLNFACKLKYVEAVAVILENSSPKIVAEQLYLKEGFYGLNIVQYVVAYSSEEVLAEILKHAKKLPGDRHLLWNNYVGFNSLQFACAKNKPEMAKLLLQHYEDNPEYLDELMKVYPSCNIDDHPIVLLERIDRDTVHLMKVLLAYMPDFHVFPAYLNLRSRLISKGTETCLEDYMKDPQGMRNVYRKELGLQRRDITCYFALVVCVCDDYFTLDENSSEFPQERFLNIMKQLPIELQAIVCHRVCGSMDESMPKRAELDPILYSLLCNC